MHFYNLILELSKKGKIELFIDMDGVISSYDFGKPLDFDKKRPLKSNIKVIEKVSKISNLDLYILSVCRTDNQIAEKMQWLDQNAPFFKKKSRIILSKEKFPNMTSAELKLNFFINYQNKGRMILVDDDNSVLSTIGKELKDKIILFQDSELID